MTWPLIGSTGVSRKTSATSSCAFSLITSVDCTIQGGIREQGPPSRVAHPGRRGDPSAGADAARAPRHVGIAPRSARGAARRDDRQPRRRECGRFRLYRSDRRIDQPQPGHSVSCSRVARVSSSGCRGPAPRAQRCASISSATSRWTARLISRPPRRWKPLIAAAETLAGIAQRTGRSAPDVVT